MNLQRSISNSIKSDGTFLWESVAGILVLGLGFGNEGQVLGLGLGFGLVLGLEISRPRTISRTSNV